MMAPNPRSWLASRCGGGIHAVGWGGGSGVNGRLGTRSAHDPPGLAITLGRRGDLYCTSDRGMSKVAVTDLRPLPEPRLSGGRSFHVWSPTDGARVPPLRREVPVRAVAAVGAPREREG